MDIALVHNKKAGKVSEQTADYIYGLYLKRLEQKGPVAAARLLEKLRTDYDYFSPKLGYPLQFRRGYSAEGGLRHISPCFAYASGYGPQDHIFDRQPDTLAEALADGAHVLLSHNEAFYHEDFRFTGMKGTGASALRDWVAASHTAGRRHVSVPVHSAADALAKIRRIGNHIPKNEMSRRVWASFGGGVMQYGLYNRTVLRRDRREMHLTAIFDALRKGEHGTPVGTTRVVGFPRLMRWVPTRDSLDTGSPFLRGNYFSRMSDGHSFIMDLVFADKDARYKDDYKELRKKLLDWGHDAEARKAGVIVLGCPFVEIDREKPVKTRKRAARSNLTWDWTGIAINDIKTQIVVPEAQEFALTG